ncbi:MULTISPECIES: TIGR04086 family membrane protein [unclassified Candidatus Frackibacter]|uniref:TIGR04086 family membrane protein n=1 Tax=unclassified Candidatus Frackibacter TaxID=2648818 RepID=UPI00088D7087|nr:MULTISPECIES: TIGR04086 family membrane protein [unclassified Candidatus Frackibacter]SDB97736.1 putative membrane protein, TIGR04086 family [Candidatus Frackibacter sp. WG11]SEM29430.1 putative membrane protein, TIGR04086 family [Candidatus Frackibacter sp. WG12]SFL34335.1 putative membrane protein, TIGR04086 family [Candidatus Frackibacter sp. WG13]
MSKNYGSDAKSLSLDFKIIAWGILVSFSLLLSGSIIIGCLITFTNINKLVVQRLLIIFNYISILMGAILTGSNVKKKGWLNGSIVGFGHMLLIFIISMLWLDALFNTSIIIMAMIGLITGVIGGMSGINIVSK